MTNSGPAGSVNTMRTRLSVAVKEEKSASASRLVAKMSSVRFSTNAGVEA
jgi:hypothetical protein